MLQNGDYFTSREMWVKVVVLFFSAVIVVGCSDPTTIGRFRATPVTNIILNSLGVVDEDPELFAGARNPNVKDLQVYEREYVISAGDLLMVKILDLFASGQEWRDQVIVSETGRITLPEIGALRAAGRTEIELTEDIENKLSPLILKDPTVTVVVIQATSKSYSVDGAVSMPARYVLTEPDLRVAEAFAAAGGMPQTGADWAFVVRKVDIEDLQGDREFMENEYSNEEWDKMLPPVPVRPTTKQTSRDREVKAEPAPKNKADQQEVPVIKEKETEEKELLESISPTTVIMVPVELGEPGDFRVEEKADSAEPDAAEEAADEEDFEMIPQSQAEPDKPLKVVRQGGKFRLMPAEGDAAEIIPVPEDQLPVPEIPQSPREHQRKEYTEHIDRIAQMQEVIRISMKDLKRGDPSQNIVIRAGDYITVPFNATGLYYMMGQIRQPGAFVLRDKLTLKQAMAAVGGLTQLACPERCDIIRRIGQDREVTCRVNLKKLFRGTQPDIFLRPNDLINIGSHPTAAWMAVVRNSFRFTYGFGFVYDRNLADKDFMH